MGKYDDMAKQDGFGRPVDEDVYWRNTGLSQGAIERIKEYHRTHPVQRDGTRLKDEQNGQTQPKTQRDRDVEGQKLLSKVWLSDRNSTMY